jgi:hypothetical protein
MRPYRLSCLPRIGAATVSELTIGDPLFRPGVRADGRCNRTSDRTFCPRGEAAGLSQSAGSVLSRRIGIPGSRPTRERPRRGDRLGFRHRRSVAGAACTRRADEDATRSAARLSCEERLAALTWEVMMAW